MKDKEVVIISRGVKIQIVIPVIVEDKISFFVKLDSDPNLIYERTTPLSFQMLETLILHQVYFNMHHIDSN